MAKRPRIIVTRRLPAPVENALEETFDVHLNTQDTPFDAEQLHGAFRQADAVLCTVGDRVTAAVIGRPPMRARLLCNFGVGTDHIDLDAARSAGLTVTNTPDVLTDCTADLTIGLMIMVMRRMEEAVNELRAGLWTGWRPTHMLGARVSGRTLGIVGFGRIGRAVARRASHGFGMRVLFHTRNVPPPETYRPLGAQPAASLDELLATCDVVSLHCPAGPDTRHLIDADRLARMRQDAFLINTARGDVVDEAALVAALREHRIAGAGLDVFEGEPHLSPALATLDNVVVLPHIGSASLETRTAMGMRALDNLRAFFAGEVPPDRVTG